MRCSFQRATTRWCQVRPPQPLPAGGEPTPEGRVGTTAFAVLKPLAAFLWPGRRLAPRRADFINFSCLPPEMLEQRPVDAKADIWGLGNAIFVACAYKLPFGQLPGEGEFGAEQALSATKGPIAV